MRADASQPDYWDHRCLTYRDRPDLMVGWKDHPFESHTKIVESLLRGLLRPGMSVLDVACGYGRFAPLVESLGCSWVGLDFSREMRRLWAELFNMGEFLVWDCRDGTPQQLAGSADVVLCVGATFASSDQAVYSLFKNSLKDMGQVIVSHSLRTEIFHHGCGAHHW